MPHSRRFRGRENILPTPDAVATSEVAAPSSGGDVAVATSGGGGGGEGSHPTDVRSVWSAQHDPDCRDALSRRRIRSLFIRVSVTTAAAVGESHARAPRRRISPRDWGPRMHQHLAASSGTAALRGHATQISEPPAGGYLRRRTVSRAPISPIFFSTIGCSFRTAPVFDACPNLFANLLILGTS